MTLEAGTRLGPYEVIGPLGAGGMGEVYRARDTRLGREVAIKVLSQHLSSSAEVRARFEREAKTVSSLNHPNICTLFDVGRAPGLAGSSDIDYLVMELVDGETLAHRLARGALPTGEVLKLGGQIADALDRAHRAGVVHRDLKPGNVMLTRSGAKLMDFGLARGAGVGGPATGSGASIAALTQSPTRAQPLTAEGTIVGTFQYMSPEQLEGREADARGDLWALGCVLYEMATGKRAFDGRSQASLISAIMSSQPPPISELAPMTPTALDRAVRQCLSKDPDERWQSAGDVRRELEWISAQGAQADAPRSEAPRARRPASAVMLVWAVAATIAALAFAWLLRSRGTSESPAFVSFRPPVGLKLSDEPGDLAISPDGKHVAFTAADSSGVPSLWIRSLGDANPREVPESETGCRPFWSPDGRWVAFFTTRERRDGEHPKLEKAPADGGVPIALCEIEWNRGGAWNAHGDIVFAPAPQGPLMHVSENGGTVTTATQLDTTRHETAQRFPSFLPDGDHFVYASMPTGAEGYRICVASLHSKEVKVIGTSASGISYADPGYLLFERERKLVAQRIDLARLALTGDPVPLAPAPPLTAEDATRIATASLDGRLLFLDREEPTCHLEWFSRNGQSLGRVPIASGNYLYNFVDPEGRRAALTQVLSRVSSQVVVVDLSRGTAIRVTDARGTNQATAWSPDGKNLALLSTREGREEIFITPADGSGEARHLPSLEGQFKSPSAWSLDGKSIVMFSLRPQTGFDLFTLPVAGGPARPLVVGPGDQIDAQVSPDGKWLVYSSTETGRAEVFLCSFPDGRERVQLTNGGGDVPRWSRSSREVFFLGPDQRTIGSVSILPGPPPRAGGVRTLFGFDAPQIDAPSWDYSPALDRFLMLRPDVAKRDAAAAVVLDWPALLVGR